MANPTNMDSDVDFQTWNNADRGGDTDKYTGSQIVRSRNANDDSMQTSAGTWIVVFEQSDFKGNCWQIDENKYFDNLHNREIYDASGHDTGNHWQGNINSFILYKQKPSWFVSGSTVTLTNEQLFDFQVLVCEDTQYGGDNSGLSGPLTCLDTSSIGYNTNGHIMSGAYAISSLKTGPNTWFLVYDHSYMAGDFKKIAPNSGKSTNQSMDYSDLNNIDRDNINGHRDGDWQDQINSFLIYNYQPEFWNTAYASPYVDFTTLYNLYPYPTNNASGNKIEYTVEDSKYTIDCPTLTYQSADQKMTGIDKVSDDTTDLPATGWTKYHVHLEHDNTMAWNDTADFDLYFDNAGKLVQIANFTWSSNGAFDVPETVIKSVDLIAWYLGTTGALETMGVSEEAADTVIDIFNFVCNAFNKIAGLVYKFTDNGGEFYFLPVICHTLNRICTTVATPYQITPLSQTMSFKIDDFPNALKSTASYGSISGWATKEGSNNDSNYNQVIEYSYSGYNYRTWYQEYSVSAGLGMFVSCKIDYEIAHDGVIDDSQDDHIILLMGFCLPTDGSSTPMISFAQAIVQFTDGSNPNINTPAYNSDAINQVCNDINNALVNVKMDSNQQGRKYIGEIAKFNMIAMSQCAYFGS